jgi:hypothetical protein
MRCLALVLAIAACGNSEHVDSSKCGRVYSRMEPLFEQEGKTRDRAVEIQRCKDSLGKHPEREVWLDCILAIDGDLSPMKLKSCEKLDKAAIRSSVSDDPGSAR